MIKFKKKFSCDLLKRMSFSFGRRHRRHRSRRSHRRSAKRSRRSHRRSRRGSRRGRRSRRGSRRRSRRGSRRGRRSHRRRHRRHRRRSFGAFGGGSPATLLEFEGPYGGPDVGWGSGGVGVSMRRSGKM
jgi:hypothetical protein